MDKIVLHAIDLDGYLTESDKNNIDKVTKMYEESKKASSMLDKDFDDIKAREKLISSSCDIGHLLKEIASENKKIHTYSFETPEEQHVEASRIISKLRNPGTTHEEFIYYMQRAYEIMFAFSISNQRLSRKRAIIQKTPVNIPNQSYAVHKVPDIDDIAHNSIMCVMLRGALLPSMIISKEFEDLSSDKYITPFALFKIKRDESRKENNMDYILDLDKSYFKLEELDGKDLIFADPMNATGGSLFTIVKYLKDNGIKPKSIKFINAISALKGALRITRAIEEAEVYTLWLDPLLNENAYILPGLGDAGDRLNGIDNNNPRNMIQLIADYGSNIVNLYRNQVKEIEKTVLG